MKFIRITGWLFLTILCLSAVSSAQYGASQGSTLVTCASDDMRYHVCEIGPNSGVRLVRQRSDARCQEGISYGVRRNQIWVDKGCRADFEVLAPGRQGTGRDPRIVTCSSDDMRRNYCGIGENDGVRLVRQRSSAKCIEGSTWGVRRNQIWVDRGCRADFEVIPERGRGRDWGRDRDNRGDTMTTTIYCASDDMRRNYCNVGKYRDIRLTRQRSDARCDLNRTYGFTPTQIWVDRGCRAEFAVEVRR